MKKSFKYGFTTCTLAYLLVVIPLLVLFSTLFRGSYEPVVDIRGDVRTPNVNVIRISGRFVLSRFSCALAGFILCVDTLDLSPQRRSEEKGII